MDFQYLVELLRSGRWAWTAEACRWLLDRLRFRETGSEDGRTEFSGPESLKAGLFGNETGPTRLEFRFAFPPLDVDPAELARVHVELMTWMMKGVLGEPGSDGRWTVPHATFHVETDPGAVFLVLEPRA